MNHLLELQQVRQNVSLGVERQIALSGQYGQCDGLSESSVRLETSALEGSSRDSARLHHRLQSQRIPSVRPSVQIEKVNLSCVQENAMREWFLPVARPFSQSVMAEWLISHFKYERRSMTDVAPCAHYLDRSQYAKVLIVWSKHFKLDEWLFKVIQSIISHFSRWWIIVFRRGGFLVH